MKIGQTHSCDLFKWQKGRSPSLLFLSDNYNTLPPWITGIISKHFLSRVWFFSFRLNWTCLWWFILLFKYSQLLTIADTISFLCMFYLRVLHYVYDNVEVKDEIYISGCNWEYLSKLLWLIYIFVLDIKMLQRKKKPWINKRR
jgi:hypothetical protein